jgi:hypothetical protein
MAKRFLKRLVLDITRNRPYRSPKLLKSKSIALLLFDCISSFSAFSNFFHPSVGGVFFNFRRQFIFLGGYVVAIESQMYDIGNRSTSNHKFENLKEVASRSEPLGSMRRSP